MDKRFIGLAFVTTAILWKAYKTRQYNKAQELVIESVAQGDNYVLVKAICGKDIITAVRFEGETAWVKQYTLQEIPKQYQKPLTDEYSKRVNKYFRITLNANKSSATI